MLVAGLRFETHGLGAQAVEIAVRGDSVRMARERGAAAGAAVNTAGWLVTGVLLPPIIVAGAWTSAASWEHDQRAGVAVGLVTLTPLMMVRNRARSVADPDPGLVASAVGSANPAIRQAFVEAYKQRVHRKRRHRINVGLGLSIPVIVGFGALIVVGLAGAEG